MNLHSRYLEELKRILSLDIIPHRDSMQNNELHFAAANGQLDIIIWLIQHGKGFSIHREEQQSSNTFGYSLGNSHLSVIQWLFKNGSSFLQERNDKGNTPILFAAFNGDITTAQWLLQNGSSCKRKIFHGTTPSADCCL